MHERSVDTSTTDDITLLDVATVVQDGWTEVPIRGRTDYRIVVHDGRQVIRAVGRNSASALVRRTAVNPWRCQEIKWMWRVDLLQHGADLASKRAEDVAASIFLLFGDPGLLVEPDPVPTLRYVWSGGSERVGSIVDNPYMPGVVRSIVVRSAEDPLGRWFAESRDLIADFSLAFGQPPGDRLHAVALFTDNDQTLEAVESYYAWIRLSCRTEHHGHPPRKTTAQEIP